MDEHDEVDIISGLPDEILLHIVSSLPFESAIQTIFVSKRWSLAWNHSLVLHGTKHDIAAAVSSFITNFNEHDPTKNIRKLCFRFDKDNSLLAIVAPNNKLHLNISSETDKKTSRNSGWHLDLISHDQNLIRHPVSSMFFVKSLFLNSVNHLTNEAVSSIFSNFHSLENLKIINCIGLTSLSVESVAKLLHLTVFDCPQLQFFKIKSFKLKTFRYRGSFPLFRLGYHFNLTDAMFDVRQGPSDNSVGSFEFDPVLLTIKNAEILTLCKWIFEALIWPSLSLFRADFQFYRLNELWWIDTSLNRENINCLISFLKLCPYLEVLFVTIDPKSFSVANTADFSKSFGKHTRLENLKLIKLEGLTSREDEIRLSLALQETVDAQPLIQSSFSDKDSMRLHKSVGGKDTKHFCPKHSQP